MSKVELKSVANETSDWLRTLCESRTPKKRREMRELIRKQQGAMNYAMGFIDSFATTLPDAPREQP